MAAVVAVLSLTICGAVAQAASGSTGDVDGASASKRAAAALEVASTIEPGDAVPPDDLGDDPDLDALADACFEGDLVACDVLYLQSPTDSPYEEYGDTCGGRQEAGTDQLCGLGTDGVDTTDTTPGSDPPDQPIESGEPVPPEDLGGDVELDALAQSCYVGDMAACDELYGAAESGSDYEDYGDSCAGRQPANTGRYCTALEDPVPGTGDVATSTTPESSTSEPSTTSTSTSPASTTTQSSTTTPAVTSSPSTEPATTTPTPTPTSTPVTQPGETTQPTGPIVPGEVPAPTLEPIGLGTDPELDALAQSCHAGDLASCDELYRSSEPDTAYRTFGDTCAGRQPEGTGVWCVDAFGGATPTDTVTLPTVPTTTQVPVPTVTAPPGTVPPGTVPPGTVPPVTPVTVPPVTAPPVTAPPMTAAPPPPTAAVPPTVTDAPMTTVPPPTTGGPVDIAGIPAPTLQPTGLGSDAALDALAQSCYDGDLVACDELWEQSEEGSDYRQFGDTCAGRQPPNTGIWCEDAFGSGGPEPTTPLTEPTVPPISVETPDGIPAAGQQPSDLGDDPVLDGLAQSCYVGDMNACDELYDTAPIGSEYRAYGDTCAGRQSAGTLDYCRVVFPTDRR